MMDNRHLRGIILNLETRLSDNDRKRLHFFLGNDVPRRIRDDPSLGGTLSLMESLFDQDKINEQDFTFLINAFDEIQCIDAVKLLREHMRRIQSSRTHESIQSLASIMPPTLDQSLEAQDEDKYAMQSLLITQRNISNNTIEMIDINNRNINPMTETVHISRSNQKKSLNVSSMTQKCLLLLCFLLLLIIGLGVLTGVIIFRSYHLTEEIKIKDKTIFEERAKNNQITHHLNSLQPMDNQTIQQLSDRLQLLYDEQKKQNGTIRQLNTLRLIDNQTIQQLSDRLQQSLDEQGKQNETIQQLNTLRSEDNQAIQQLNNQLQQFLKEQTKKNETIQQLNTLRSVDNQTIRELTNQSKQLRKEQTENNQTIQQLRNQLQQSLVKTTPSKKNNVPVTENDQIDPNEIEDPESTSKIASTRFPHIKPNTRWAQNGITVAGSYDEDNSLDSLHPFGFVLDADDRTILIADYMNHRVMEWKFGATSGQVVAGGNQRGNRNNQLNFPTDVIMDKQTDSLIICDRENWRVVRWPRRDGVSGETIISNIKCFGLTMDAQGFLYVSDLAKHEVTRWRVGETQGTIVAGGNRQGHRLDQLDSPQFIFIDPDNSLFVSDSSNHRVMKWVKDAKEGIVVTGGQGERTALTQLLSPEGVLVDQWGSVYVADCANHRVMRWSEGATLGSLVVGGNGFGRNANQLSCPRSLSFDLDSNLYVADYNNNRIQKFEVNKVG